MSKTISLFNSILEDLHHALAFDTNMITEKLSTKQDAQEAARLSKFSQCFLHLIKRLTKPPVQELLIGEEPETLLRNDLEDCEDKACEWIIRTAEYQRWRNVMDIKYLALVDSSGFGKSVSAAYLATYLTGNGELVCSYHLNQSINMPESIYRGLLHQIPTERSSLQPRYVDWREHEVKNKTIVTCSRKDLREFLVKCLRVTDRVTYLILDGFDECLPSCQRELNELFEELRESEVPVKLFLSSSSSLSNQFSSLSKLEIAMDKSEGKDLLIATYWTRRCLTGTESSLQCRIATYLAAEAQGSGLWIRLAAE